MTELERIAILNDVLSRLGAARAVEANTPATPPTPNPWGLVGVDFDRGKWRARIAVCSALDGKFKRMTLYRGDSSEEAQYAYYAAHIAVYGSASFAAYDDIIEDVRRAKDAGGYNFTVFSGK